MLITESIKLDTAIDLIANSPKLVYDIETTSLNTRQGQVIGFGLSNGTDSVYIAHLSWDGEQLIELIPKAECKLILEALVKAGTKLICHNASFDLRYTLHYFGVDLIDLLWSDSMLCKHLADENTSSGLKEIGARLFGSDAKDEQSALKESIKENGGTTHEYFKADLKILAEYCIKDCVLTWKVNEHYLKELENQDLLEFFLETETMALYREVTIPMELYGIPVDVPYLEKSKTELQEELDKLEKQVLLEIEPFLGEFRAKFFDKYYPAKSGGLFAQTLALLTSAPVGKTKSGAPSLAAKEMDKLHDSHPLKKFINDGELDDSIKLSVQKRMHGDSPLFNIMSTDHLVFLFFTILKETPISFTKEGQPQVNEGFMLQNMDKYPFMKSLYTYKKLSKIKGTYVDRILDEQEGGIFYPAYFQHRTTSGRFSGDFQQLPKPLEPDDEPIEVIRYYNNRIREFFIAKDGYIFIDDDYESAEPRIFAHISNEPEIKAIFSRGDCFYSTIAILVEGLQDVSANKKAPNFLGKVSKSKRQAAKVYALGIPYSMSGYKLQYEINVSLEEAERLVKKYLETFPNLANWMQTTYKKVYTEGYVRTEAGRIRHLQEAVTLYNKYGPALLDDLELWKAHHENYGYYQQAKKDRRKFKNLIANGSNVQIQGLVASMINRAAIAVAREYKRLGLNARICANLHDELLVYADLQDKEKAAMILQDKMENTMKFSVPMVAVPSFGKNFREAKG